MLRTEMPSRLILAFIIGGALLALNRHYPESLKQRELQVWNHLRRLPVFQAAPRESLAVAVLTMNPRPGERAPQSLRGETLNPILERLAQAGVRGVVFSRTPGAVPEAAPGEVLERAARLGARLQQSWTSPGSSPPPEAVQTLQDLIETLTPPAQAEDRSLVDHLRRLDFVAFPLTCGGQALDPKPLPAAVVDSQLAARLGWIPDPENPGRASPACEPLPPPHLLEAADTAGWLASGLPARTPQGSVFAWQSHAGYLIPCLPLAVARALSAPVGPGARDPWPADARLEIVAPTPAGLEVARFRAADLLADRLAAEGLAGQLVVIAPEGDAAPRAEASNLAAEIQHLAQGAFLIRHPRLEAAELALLALALALTVCPSSRGGRAWWLVWGALLLAAGPLAGYLILTRHYGIQAPILLSAAAAALALRVWPRLPGPAPAALRLRAEASMRPPAAAVSSAQDGRGAPLRKASPAPPAAGPPPPSVPVVPLPSPPRALPAASPEPEGNPPAGAESSPLPACIGRYEIIRLLGRGAMGSVYLGRDPRINRLTAIKTFRFGPSLAVEDTRALKEKFFREAESAGTLSHPYIVTIYDAGEADELAFIAMEYLEGESLWRYARRSRLLPIPQVIRIGIQVAEALDYAHAKGIVHRDIKPANLIRMPGGDIKITDFGIARIAASSETQTGVVKGTPYYMSPEQFSGARVDGRSDIFSLGTTLFQLLTGSLPFYAKNPAVLMNQIMNFPHPSPKAINPRVMSPLAAILDRALEKNVEARFPTAGDMAACLRELDQRIREAQRRSRSASRDRTPQPAGRRPA